MGRRFGGSKKKAQPKSRKLYDLITIDTEEGKEVFKLLDQVKKQWKEDLHKARVGAAWMIGKKPDKDGRIVLGRMKKCSELERQIHSLDAILILNQEHWRVFSKEQRLALVHHELCHLAQAEDANGDQAIDGHGSLKWRLVRHDIEEFRAVVAAHGCYKNDLAEFVAATLKRDPNLSLFDKEKNARAEKPVGKDVMAPTNGEAFASPEAQAVECGACGHTEFNHKTTPRPRCIVRGCKCEGFAAPVRPAAPTAAEEAQAH